MDSEHSSNSIPPSSEGSTFKKVLRAIWRIASEYLWPLLYSVIKITLIVLWWILRQLWNFARKVAFPLIRAGYYRLPERQRIPITLLVVLLIGFGCTVYINAGIPGLKRNPAHPALSDFIVTSDLKLLNGSWEEQKLSAKDILLATGFDVLLDSAEPREEVPFVIAPELTLLTYDASRKPEGGGRLTLEQFAEMMRDFEFPFAPGEDPAALLQSGIRHWVQNAQSDPSLPGAAAPLFLAEMAKAQFPSIDLTKDDWSPSEYRMTFLEMQVFLGAFLQAFSTEQEPEIGFLDRLLGMRTASAAETPLVCTNFKKWMNDWGNTKIGSETIVSSGVELITIFISELTGASIKAISKVASKVIQVINVLLKLQKLAMLYHSIEIEVTPDPDMPHMPGPDEKNKEIRFTAVVGVNDQKYQEYLNQWNSSDTVKTIKDCLSFAGLPMWTDSGDIAADVENWSVEWDIVQGGGTLVTWGLKNNDFEFAGQQQMKLVRTGPNKGEAVFTTDLVKEKVKKHRGTDRIDTVTVRASADTAGMPPILTQLVNGVKMGYEDSKAFNNLSSVAESALWGLLGIVETLADIVTGWYQSLVKPEGYGYAHVMYHEKNDGPFLLGTIKTTSHSLEEFTDGSRLEINYTQEIELLERVRFVRGEYGDYWLYKARLTYSGRDIGIIDASENSVCPADFRDVKLSWNGNIEAKVSFDEEGNLIIVETESFDLDASGRDCGNPNLNYHNGKFGAFIPYKGKSEKLNGSKNAKPTIIQNEEMKWTEEGSTRWNLTLKY